MPCPFCIFQRICFAVLGLVFLFGAACCHSPWCRCAQGTGAAGRRRGGIGYAGRHAWVQLYPPELPSCGPGLNFMVEQHSARCGPAVLLTTGDCSNIDWQFLGLTMPMWSLVWFIGLAIWALRAAFRRRNTHRFHR